MVELNGVATFVTVVESGGFSEASRRLNLTRSAVSKSISKLEARLGVTLFHRTTRVLKLTEEGRQYFSYCERALEELKSAELGLEAGRAHVSGRLRVSVPVIYGRQCVAPLLLSLLRAHEQLEIDIAFSDRVVDLVEDGFDLAIRLGAATEHGDLMTRTVAQQNMLVCAAPAYLERAGIPDRIEQIKEHDGIIYGRRDRNRTWIFPTTAKATQQILPRSRACLDDLEAIAAATVGGLGLAWLPVWLVRDKVASGNLVRLFPDTPMAGFPTRLVWAKSPILQPKLRLAIDTLARELAALTE